MSLLSLRHSPLSPSPRVILWPVPRCGETRVKAFQAVLSRAVPGRCRGAGGAARGCPGSRQQPGRPAGRRRTANQHLPRPAPRFLVASHWLRRGGGGPRWAAGGATGAEPAGGRRARGARGCQFPRPQQPHLAQGASLCPQPSAPRGFHVSTCPLLGPPSGNGRDTLNHPEIVLFPKAAVSVRFILKTNNNSILYETEQL